MHKNMHKDMNKQVTDLHELNEDETDKNYFANI